MRFIVAALLSVTLMFSHVYAAQRSLLVVGEEFAPFEFIQSGRVVGLDIDIAKHIFKKMGIEVEFKILPWKRAWHSIETGKADAILSTSRKDTRKPFLWYPSVDMWISEFVFFVQRSNFEKGFNGYESAIHHNYRIGVINGNSYHKSFWNAFPYKNGADTFQGDLATLTLNDQLDGGVDLNTNLRKLSKGRFDLLIADRVVGGYSTKLLSLSSFITHYDKVLFSKRYPMPFAKNSSYPNIKNVSQEFEKELKELLLSPLYKEMVNAWIK